MRKILLVGNPNVGKTTLFNSLTKSAEHTGNFHGVTVEEKSKRVVFQNEDFEIIDLPGLYSLNAISPEEEVAAKQLIKGDCEIFVVADANCLRKNLYLCQQLNELGIDYKLLINNNKSFEKYGNKINFNKLKNNLNKELFEINAKKIKLNSELMAKTSKNKEKYIYLNKYIKEIKNKYNLDEKTIIYALNGIFFNLKEEIIEFVKLFYDEIIKDRYAHIDNILKDCIKIKKEFVYGRSGMDKILLNPLFATMLFLTSFFLGFYLIFFFIGPFISSIEEFLFEFLIVNPVMNLIYMVTDNVWLIEFVRTGVLSSIATVISFVPQVVLMFVFLSVLEDSGIVARFAYVFDDVLTSFGLNGKTIYSLMLGLGCNTMSTLTTRNLSDKNLKVKTAIINPYISCMARLPVYVLIASAFLGKHAFWLIAGLYTLGVLVALIMSLVLDKTILKSKANDLLIEFPPMKGIDIFHIFQVAKVNAKDFFKRVFSTVLCVGVIIWILTHTQFNLQYTQNISQSILFLFAEKLSFIFAPIGLNNAGIVCALVVGFMAKELIVSTIGICNNISGQKALMTTLALSTSVISFNMASAVSFLIFSLLYSPCVSNLAVIKKEAGKFYMWFSLTSQLTIAYLISFLVYNALTKGFAFSVVVLMVIVLIMFAVIFIIKKVKQQKCLTCGKCK